MGTMEKESKETGVAHLFMDDDATSTFWCMQVDCKEAKPEIVAWMNQNLIDAGCVGMRVTLKSDGEPAMQAVKGALELKRGCETSIIRSPARESQSHVADERAIQNWKSQVRQSGCIWRTD